MAAKAKKTVTPAPETIIAYKGFEQDLSCRGYKYEVGKTYQHTGEVKACAGGFHACEHPLNVFEYYPPALSRYALVEMGGEISRDSSDTKIASATITIKAELKLPELIASAIRWVFDRSKPEGEAATGNRGAASATGWYGRVMGKEGCALFLVYRNDGGEIVHAWAGIAGLDGIKADTWYSLNAKGEPEEVTP